MIMMDTPRVDMFKGRPILTAHLLSTLPGPEGTAELVEFALSLGLKREWIQFEGTYREHFDLMGVRCAEAQRAGVQVAKIGHVLVAKREGRGYTPAGPTPGG